MWKKFLAAFALVGILSTSTASAISNGDEPGGNVPAGSYVSNFTVTPTSFDPVKKESVTISYKLETQADIYAYIFNETAKNIPTTFENVKAKPVGQVSYTWYGREGNPADGTVLAPGTFTFRLYVFKDGNVQYFDKVVTIVASNAAKIIDLKAIPSSFSPATNQVTDIYFELSKGAKTKVLVKSGSTEVKVLMPIEFRDFGKYSIQWDGKDKDGKVVVDGNYTVEVTAMENDFVVATASTPVEVKTKAPGNKGIIKDFYLDPNQKWDPTDGELEINYELTSDAKSVKIMAEQGNKKPIEILNDKIVDDDDYTETWDGTDDDGDFVDEGKWVITIFADGDQLSESIDVKYDQPAIVEAFVSKDEFDPSEDEFINFVFKIDTKSEVTLEVFKGAQKEVKLLDDELVSKNKWYAVSWDGRDKDGEEVDFSNDWKFKITARNSTDDDILATKSIEFDVQKDDVSDKKANVTNDYSSPVVFDDASESAIKLNYTIDEDAEVFIAVYEGLSTGGKAEIELLDYIKQDVGPHDVKWNGKNAKNKSLKDGIYTYKIISKANGNYKETEVGRFVVGNAGAYFSESPAPEPTPAPTPEPTPVPTPTPVATTCGSYIDTKFVANDNYELCDAIQWVTKEGIFKGYADGSFGPYNNISRSEVLKVVFESFKTVTILPSDGTNLGFWDLDSSAWYMPYVRTAKFYSMLQGYKDGSAGPAKNISRAEFLKFALKASEAFAGYVTPKYSFSYYLDVDVKNVDQAWYKDFAGVAYDMGFFNNYGKDYEYGAPMYLQPDKSITRGEVALILYKMYNSAYMLGYGPAYEEYAYPMY